MMGSNLDIVGAIAEIQLRYYRSKPIKPLVLKIASWNWNIPIQI